MEQWANGMEVHREFALRDEQGMQNGQAAKMSPMREFRTESGSDAAPVFEKHYSVKELAELWNLSERTIRRMFIEEPGVVEWGADERRRKRPYKTIRIPESVARRVHRRLRKAS
jgi:hypothetical protein